MRQLQLPKRVWRKEDSTARLTMANIIKISTNKSTTSHDVIKKLALDRDIKVLVVAKLKLRRITETSWFLDGWPYRTDYGK